MKSALILFLFVALNCSAAPKVLDISISECLSVVLGGKTSVESFEAAPQKLICRLSNNYYNCAYSEKEIIKNKFTVVEDAKNVLRIGSVNPSFMAFYFDKTNHQFLYSGGPSEFELFGSSVITSNCRGTFTEK